MRSRAITIKVNHADHRILIRKGKALKLQDRAVISVSNLQMINSVYILSLLLGVLFCKTVNSRDGKDVIKGLSLKLSESQVKYS